MEGRSEYKKGLWTVEEDKILTDYIRVHGKGKWNRVAKVTESRESSSVPSESNSRPPPNCNGGAVGFEVNGSGSLSTMDFYSPQEQQLWSSDEFDHNSFWLSIIDDLNLQVPNLMELTLDFI
ncbi:hypothetical protein Pint_15432 [Pistacia integerrima]|uniref:Uncharacterized protein n=1 Tax=Pistacia integerrima TaxID=434235 RepID=A0ACC0Z9V2_9ROSI|nr:hypothetical protein Pint_15432 [Pistacia integerrima]